jgi:soluble lytic murein transglycosylase
MRRLLGVLMLLPLLAVAAKGGAIPADADSRFLAARDAFRQGERVKLSHLAESLRGNDLEPWAEYWLLRLRLDEDVSDGVRDFLVRNNGAYVAEKLRAEWLRKLARDQDWQTFQQEYPLLVQPEQDLACSALQAQLVRQQDPTALDEARPLWFSVVDLPETCTPLMQGLFAAGRLTEDDTWIRLRRLLEAKKLPAAKQLLQHLPADQRPTPKALEAVADAPARHLAKLPANFAATRSGRELALFAIQHMARNDPGAAATLWRGIEGKFGDEDRAYAWGQIAWQAALHHLPEATDWFGRGAGSPMCEDQLAWKARAALRAGDWAKVAQAIGDMPPLMAAQADWTYWLARAQASQGRGDEATILFQRIGGLPNFYSNLADEELGRPLTVPPQADAITTDELMEAAGNAGLKRALALIRLDMRAEGAKEWNWSLRGLDDRHLLAAAELARRYDIYDRSISAADRTLAQHDYSLRYPAPFRDLVEPQARQLSLDGGWVYGLMRQESRFIMDAKSSVGAKGLMQLMPATARWVAHKIGLADYRPGRVTDMDTNVILGTSYLKMVLDSLDNQPVLASAAYNAGPGRARKWRADRPLEGAIYAETIPLSETRDYVKKVMCNAVYYTALFENKPQSLKSRLGIVGPRGKGETGVAELP